MNAKEVYQILNQVLQTLDFLHTQKFSLPSSQVQHGLVHGNLSLDSLLIVNQELPIPTQEDIIDIDLEDPEDSEFVWYKYRIASVDDNFFIYLCDLALWENLFNPLNLQNHNSKQSKNGRITFEQLRKLYFGKINNWQQKPINASNVDVRLFLPDDNTAVEIFESRLLEAKGFFDKRQKILTKQSHSFLSSATPSLRPPTINKIISKYRDSSFARLLQTVYREFEDNNLGAIAYCPYPSSSLFVPVEYRDSPQQFHQHGQILR